MVLLKHKMYNLKLCKNVAHRKIIAFNGQKIPYKVGGMFRGERKEKSKSEIPYFAKFRKQWFQQYLTILTTVCSYYGFFFQTLNI